MPFRLSKILIDFDTSKSNDLLDKFDMISITHAGHG